MIMGKWGENSWVVGFFDPSDGGGITPVAITKGKDALAIAISLCNHLNGGNGKRWAEFEDSIEWR